LSSFFQFRFHIRTAISFRFHGAIHCIFFGHLQFFVVKNIRNSLFFNIIFEFVSSPGRNFFPGKVFAFTLCGTIAEKGQQVLA